MDPLLSRFIFDKNTYPGSHLPIVVTFTKKIPGDEFFFLIDDQNSLWICSLDPELAVFLVTDKVKVIDVCNYGDNLIVLSDDGDLYFIYDYFQKGGYNIGKIDIDAKFISINSGGDGWISAIDIFGNLWSNYIGFFGSPLNYNYINLIQYTKDISFVQAEYGTENLMCLDGGGNLYCIGNNYYYDLILDQITIEQLTKLTCPIKFRKISKQFLYTLLIDVENNLWICGTQPSYEKMFDQTNVPLYMVNCRTPRKIAENVDNIY